MAQDYVQLQVFILVMLNILILLQETKLSGNHRFWFTYHRVSKNEIALNLVMYRKFILTYIWESNSLFSFLFNFSA